VFMTLIFSFQIMVRGGMICRCGHILDAKVKAGT
jgi:hypothetical protein